MTDTKPYFDSNGFYKAIDATRTARNMNWKDVAEAATVSASTLTRMSQGKKPDAESQAKLSRWAGINPADYVRAGIPEVSADPLAVISSCLSSDPNLTKEGANALDEIIKVAYKSLRKE